MAIDQESPPDVTDLNPIHRPVIENEIPTYRAVSTRAIFAVICGVLALLSFAHPLFYVFAVLAVVLGISADRAIQRRPEMLTGQGLARTGVVMGLVFGLSIATLDTVQTYLLKRQAGNFAARYAELLKSSSLAEIYYRGLTPQARANTTAQENFVQMQSKREEAAMAEMKYAPLKKLNEFLKASPEHKITFLRIESLESQDLIPVALALFEVEDAAGHEDHDGHEFAVAMLKGVIPEGKKSYEWWVDDLRYPYQPASYVIPVQPVDDGHGHDKGGGGHAH